jgi:hypothetical protein
MRTKVEEYLNAVLPALNLPQWKVKISKDIPNDDAWADVEVSENLWEANLRISDDFFRETPESQRRILAHEMVHVHQASVERLVNTLEGVLGSQGYEILDKLWDTETERVAEAMSFVIAQVMPMPEFKEGRKRA